MNLPVRALFLAAATMMLAAQAQAKVVEWSCVFPIVANPNGVTRDQDLKMVFALDDATGKAKLTENSGTREVTVIAGQAVISFLDQMPSGTLRVTAIDAQGRSVQSRHTMIGNNLLPSQSYGSCTHN